MGDPWGIGGFEGWGGGLERKNWSKKIGQKLSKKNRQKNLKNWRKSENSFFE